MKVEDMDYTELVDWAAGEVMKGLLKGEFRGTVRMVLARAMDWHMAKEVKDAKSKKK